MSFEKECVITLFCVAIVAFFCCGLLAYKTIKLRDGVEELEVKLRQIEKRMESLDG